jgi:hypothetical protein
VISWLRREWSLGLALALALALRVYQLGDQILVGDEWHALDKAASAGWLEIATTFGRADHSIPIALYDRALASTIGLSEPWIRAPFLLSGLVLVLVLPLAARRFVPRAVADALAWLLAASPVLVFYSRFARPYTLTCPLALLAVWLAWRFWDERRAGFGLGYALCVASAGYLHAAVLPFVLAPLALFAFLALRSRRGEDLRAVLAVGVITGFACALALLPPFVFDAENMGRKSGFGLPQPITVIRALRLLAGPSSSVLAYGFALPCAFGCWWLVRRERLARLFALAACAQALAVLAIAPAHRSDIFAFARYLLPLLPCGLLALACGLWMPLRNLPERVQAGLGPLVGVFLVAAGPLAPALSQRTNWAANELVLHMLGQDEDFGERVPRVSDFYRDLGRRAPGSVTLIEAPWFPPIFANAEVYYQRLHRQVVRVGFLSEPGGGPVRQGEPAYPASGFRLAHFLFVEDLLRDPAPKAD